jgi:hypothetical protein
MEYGVLFGTQVYLIQVPSNECIVLMLALCPGLLNGLRLNLEYYQVQDWSVIHASE